MRRRPRIAVAENVIRGLIGEPQLATAGGKIVRTLGIAHERDIGQPLVYGVGPVEVRGAARISARAVVRVEGRAIEIEVPDTPERQAAALATTGTGMMIGGWIGEVAFHDTGYIVIGALAGWLGAVRLWNRWMRESRAPRNRPS